MANESTTIPGGGRFVVAAPSLDALAQKASVECENATPFARKVRNISDRKVAVLMKPNATSEGTGRHIEPGEIFEVVARAYRSQDGRTYVRLRESESGWVSTRSRKDFWKVVLGPVGGTALEPAGHSIENDSHAQKLLAHVSYDCERLNAEGQPLTAADAGTAPAMQSWRFHVLSTRALPITSQPSLTEGTSMRGVALAAREEFIADAVHVDHKDGRAYLHLQDCRGWVCERSRTDFSKFAVEPLNEEDGASKTSPKKEKQ